MKKIFFVLTLIIGVGGFMHCNAQESEPILMEAQKQELVKRVAQLMQDKYIFPKLGAKMANYIQERNKNKAYAALKFPDDFRHQITRDLQLISKDKHISLSYNPARAKRLSKGPLPKPSPERMRMIEESEQNRNYGFEKVERLLGNVGYLDLRGFYDPERGAETVANALGFLSNSKGIIIDLRRNGGGSPRMVQLLCSYFFGEKSIQLNGFYWREGNRKDEFWTLKNIKGKRMPKKPLFILTSGGTFSAAEDFSYNMQARKRATIVGETTGGGAHPVRSFAVGDMLVLAVPIGRSFNPITKTNWEGVGVIPDIKTSAATALDRAHLEMLKLIRSKAGNPANLDWAIQGMDAKVNPVTLKMSALKSYAGDYTNRRIVLKDNHLYYQRPSLSQSLRKLTPINQELFLVEGLTYFRLKFRKDKKGKIVAVVGVYDDGRLSVSKRGKIVE